MQYARLVRFATLLLMIIGAASTVALAAAPRPANEVFQFGAQADDQGEDINLIWKIAPGYYLYRDRISGTLNGKKLQIVTSRGEVKDDPTFGPTEIYRTTAAANIGANSLPDEGEIQITCQGCQEDTICYPPITKVINLATLVVTEPPDTGGNHDIAVPGSNQPAVPPTTGFEAESNILNGGYLSTLIAFLGFGLLLAFTPCVFPMIPIFSGMLARSGGGLPVGRSVALSATYVLAMASAYGVLGVFAAWSGENLQAALQTNWAIALMSAIFLALAFSMFGLFELRLPQAWSSRLACAAGNKGSVAGAALLGFGSALIVGPCVTPPLAAALVFVAQTGNTLRGSSALFALGLGMGLPLLAFGVLGARVLPRPGPWLTRINRIFGFVFVGLAIWMASRILPVSIVAACWGLLFISLGCYVSAPSILPLPAWKPLRIAFAATAVAGIAYGIVLLFGARIAEHESLRPLAMVGLVSSDTADDFKNVSDESDLDAAIASASKQGRITLIDFSAEWCTECKVMERSVFSQDIVRRQLRGMFLIRADLTHLDQSSKKLMRRFGVVGPPTIIFLSPDGTEISDTRIVGGTEVEAFLTKIAKALRA